MSLIIDTGSRSRALDFLDLTKPRIAVMVLFSVASGGALAGARGADLWIVLHTVIGTTLVAAGAGVLNHFWERKTDKLMERTANRPLPSGRLQPMESLIFGLTLGLGGTSYLLATVAHQLTAWLALFTLVSYVFIYTPLKQITTWNTLIGAVPGAMPPVIGWVGVQGTIGPEAIALFMILFTWQIPHFLAIAWMYREQYAQGGHKMLSSFDPGGNMTSLQMRSYALGLIPVSLTPILLQVAGPLFLCGALVLGFYFLGKTLEFNRERSLTRARKVLRASLVYLPSIWALLVADHFLRGLLR
ncbi:MAG: protoheme IX farnesyltransferase [Gemmataceae bacterium]|nr:protoheme IX farnesyltransferase [Gemmataceae bacterium]